MDHPRRSKGGKRLAGTSPELSRLAGTSSETAHFTETSPAHSTGTAPELSHSAGNSYKTLRLPDISERIRKRRVERVRNHRAKRNMQRTLQNGDVVPVFARAHGKRKSGGKTASGKESGNVAKNHGKSKQGAANAAENGENVLLSAVEAVRQSEEPSNSGAAAKQSKEQSGSSAAGKPSKEQSGSDADRMPGFSTGESAGVKHRRRDLYIPLGILSAILFFCVWSGMYLSVRTQQWNAQLDYVETLVRREEWDGAWTALSADYTDWYASHNLLHVVCRHDAVDNAEELYRRCLILIQEQDSDSFLTDLTSLRHQLESIAEREYFSLGNIL